MTNAIPIPEMQISDDERMEMLECYISKRQHYGNEYITSSGKPSGMFVVNNFEPIPIMNRLFGQIPEHLIKESAFMSNYGIGQHRDATRQCVLSIEIFNLNQETMNFVDQDGTRDPMFYKGRTMMWNPQTLHEVPQCEKIRILYQIELLDNQPFEYYVNLYRAGQLITPAT